MTKTCRKCACAMWRGVARRRALPESPRDERGRPEVDGHAGPEQPDGGRKVCVDTLHLREDGDGAQRTRERGERQPRCGEKAESRAQRKRGHGTKHRYFVKITSNPHVLRVVLYSNGIVAPPL
jgi:hypothetical protein